jgi:hypothetical protein
LSVQRQPDSNHAETVRAAKSYRRGTRTIPPLDQDHTKAGPFFGSPQGFAFPGVGTLPSSRGLRLPYTLVPLDQNPPPSCSPGSPDPRPGPGRGSVLRAASEARPGPPYLVEDPPPPGPISRIASKEFAPVRRVRRPVLRRVYRGHPPAPQGAGSARSFSLGGEDLGTQQQDDLRAVLVDAAVEGY